MIKKKNKEAHSPSDQDDNRGDDRSKEDKATKSAQGHNGAQIELGLLGFLAIGIIDGEGNVDIGRLVLANVDAVGDLVVLWMRVLNDLLRVARRRLQRGTCAWRRRSVCRDRRWSILRGAGGGAGAAAAAGAACGRRAAGLLGNEHGSHSSTRWELFAHSSRHGHIDDVLLGVGCKMDGNVNGD